MKYLAVWKRLSAPDLNNEILLNLVCKIKYLTDQFQLCFVFALATPNSYILFLDCRHSWHPYRQLASCCIRVVLPLHFGI